MTALYMDDKLRRNDTLDHALSFQNSPTKPILANAASASGTVFDRQLGLKRSSYHSLALRHLVHRFILHHSARQRLVYFLV
jgi:hypothetical protein